VTLSPCLIPVALTFNENRPYIAFEPYPLALPKGIVVCVEVLTAVFKFGAPREIAYFKSEISMYFFELSCINCEKNAATLFSRGVTTNTPLLKVGVPRLAVLTAAPTHFVPDNVPPRYSHEYTMLTRTPLL
jgi:hypothetical protein